MKKTIEKLKIKKEYYDSNQSVLVKLGYTTEQADKIILRESSYNTVEKLIKLHPELSRYFNHEQLTRIGAHNGGSKNLEAVKTNYDELKALGFTADHIVKIVAHGGGSKNLEVAAKYANYALQLESFSKDTLVKLVCMGKKGREWLKARVTQDISAMVDNLDLNNGFLACLIGNEEEDKFDTTSMDVGQEGDLAFSPEEVEVFKDVIKASLLSNNACEQPNKTMKLDGSSNRFFVSGSSGNRIDLGALLRTHS